jgi:hypothetical protein
VCGTDQSWSGPSESVPVTRITSMSRECAKSRTSYVRRAHPLLRRRSPSRPRRPCNPPSWRRRGDLVPDGCRSGRRSIRGNRALQTVPIKSLVNPERKRPGKGAFKLQNVGPGKVYFNRDSDTTPRTSHRAEATPSKPFCRQQEEQFLFAARKVYFFHSLKVPSEWPPIPAVCQSSPLKRSMNCMACLVLLKTIAASTSILARQNANWSTASLRSRSLFTWSSNWVTSRPNGSSLYTRSDAVMEDVAYIVRQHFQARDEGEVKVPSRSTRLEQQQIILTLFGNRLCDAAAKAELELKAQRAAMLPAQPAFRL